MIVRIAEYTVREREVETVLAVVRGFVRAVRENEPETRYEAYRRGGTLSFAHLMSFPSEEAEAAHRAAPYTRTFVAELYPRCEREPVFTELLGIAGEASPAGNGEDA